MQFLKSKGTEIRSEGHWVSRKLHTFCYFCPQIFLHVLIRSLQGTVGCTSLSLAQGQLQKANFPGTLNFPVSVHCGFPLPAPIIATSVPTCGEWGAGRCSPWVSLLEPPSEKEYLGEQGLEVLICKWSSKYKMIKLKCV